MTSRFNRNQQIVTVTYQPQLCLPVARSANNQIFTRRNSNLPEITHEQSLISYTFVEVHQQVLKTLCFSQSRTLFVLLESDNSNKQD